MSLTSTPVRKPNPGAVIIRLGCRNKALIRIPFDLAEYNLRRLRAAINGWRDEPMSTIASAKEPSDA